MLVFRPMISLHQPHNWVTAVWTGKQSDAAFRSIIGTIFKACRAVFQVYAVVYHMSDVLFTVCVYRTVSSDECTVVAAERQQNQLTTASYRRHTYGQFCIDIQCK